MSNGSATGRITRASAYRAVLAFLVVALVPLGLFIMVEAWFSHDDPKPMAGGITTTGKIVSTLGNGIGGGGTPVIAFTDEAGRRVVFDGAGAVNRPQIGSAVSVFYKPGDPTEASYVSDPDALWPIHLIIGLFMALLGGWGIWRIWSYRALQRAFAPRSA